MKIAFMAVLLISSMFSYADLSEREVAELLKYNVVSINSTFNDNGNDTQFGFGWIIAKDRTMLYIVTAEHVVKQKKNEAETILPTVIDVRFFDDPVRVYKATLTEASSFNDYDVAIVTVPMPTRQPWLYSAIGDEGIIIGEKVSFVGNSTEWLVPEQSGVVKAKVSSSNVNARYDYIVKDLSLDVGTSGGPLVTNKGIVGMIVAHSSEATGVVSIGAIQKIVTEESKLPWSLHAYAEPLELNGIWGPKTANIPEAVRLQFSKIDAAHFKYSLSLPSVPTFDEGVGVIDGDRVRIWQPLSNGEESYGEYQVYTEKNQAEVVLMDGNLSHAGKQQASVRLAKMLESDDIKTANTLDPRTVKLMKQNPTIIENFANRLEQAAQQNGTDELGIPLGLSEVDENVLKMGWAQGKVIPGLYKQMATNGITGVNFSIRSIENDKVTGMRNKCYVAEGKVKSEEQYMTISKILDSAVVDASSNLTNRSNNMNFQACNETFYANPSTQASFDFGAELVRPQALLDTIMPSKIKLSVEGKCLLVVGQATSPIYEDMLQNAMKQLAKELSAKSKKSIMVCQSAS